MSVSNVASKPQIVSVTDNEIVIEGLPNINLNTQEEDSEISEICHHLRDCFREGKLDNFISQQERFHLDIAYSLYFYPEHIEYISNGTETPQACTTPGRFKIRFFENYAKGNKPHWVKPFHLAKPSNLHDIGLYHYVRRMYLRHDAKQSSRHGLIVKRPMSPTDIIYFRSLFVSACAEELQVFFDATYHESITRGTKPDYYGLPESTQ